MSLRIVPRLQQLHPDVSGRRLKRAVVEGQVTVDGEVVDDPGVFVADGSAVIWDPNRKIRRRVDTSLEVLYEDDELLVVNKAAGVSAQPTRGRIGDSLVDLASAHLGRPAGLVHRLDKETSGVTVFGKTPEATATGSRPGITC